MKSKRLTLLLAVMGMCILTACGSEQEGENGEVVVYN